MRIGFIGVGSMGAPMAHRLRAAGHDLIVMDNNNVAAEAFVKEGGSVAQSPRAVGDAAEVVFCSLPTPAIVKDVILGASGVALGAAVRTVIDFSTTGPTAAVEVARGLATRGKQLFDAPVSGGIAGAKKGTVAIMAAGPRAVFKEISPLLELIGRVFFVGEKIGDGHAMKLLNNILSAMAVAATTEVMALGVKFGLDASTMIDVLNAGSGQNTATKDKYPRSILNREFNYGFRTDLVLKDIRLCQEFAREQGVKLRIGDAVVSTWELAEREFEHADYTNIVRVLEREAGVTIGRERKT
jgi:3-hydroxyisobutyrate dehydrogenase-like beta-hydroxyacid dehydrogenase